MCENDREVLSQKDMNEFFKALDDPLTLTRKAIETYVGTFTTWKSMRAF